MTNINYFFLNYVYFIIILIMLLFYIQNNWYNILSYFIHFSNYLINLIIESNFNAIICERL